MWRRFGFNRGDSLGDVRYRIAQGLQRIGYEAQCGLRGTIRNLGQRRIDGRVQIFAPSLRLMSPNGCTEEYGPVEPQGLTRTLRSGKYTRKPVVPS